MTDDLGEMLRAARIGAGLSLAGLARRTGFSRSYLSNVENGERRVTPALIRSYEKALSEVGADVNRRNLLMAAASTMVAGAVPDIAVDVARDISAERSKLLSTAQTTHATDKAIAALVAQDLAGVASLTTWMRKGPPILRVNASGILGKLRVPTIDDLVVRALRSDPQVRRLYGQAVAARVLILPWDESGHLIESDRLSESYIEPLAAEVMSPHDAGARWCSLALLSRVRQDAPGAVNGALARAIQAERSTEVLRSLAAVLGGLDPINV